MLISWQPPIFIRFSVTNFAKYKISVISLYLDMNISVSFVVNVAFSKLFK